MQSGPVPIRKRVGVDSISWSNGPEEPLVHSVELRSPAHATHTPMITRTSPPKRVGFDSTSRAIDPEGFMVRIIELRSPDDASAHTNGRAINPIPSARIEPDLRITERPPPPEGRNSLTNSDPFQSENGSGLTRHYGPTVPKDCRSTLPNGDHQYVQIVHRSPQIPFHHTGPGRISQTTPTRGQV
jgi:hypothetical protein